MLFGEADWSTIPVKFQPLLVPIIFSNTNGTLVLNAYFQERHTSGLVADYVFAVIMIVCFAASTFLNPVVFYFSYQQDVNLKLTKYLFLLLSASDFLTNFWFPLKIAGNLLSPKVLPVIRPATIWEQVVGVFYPVFVGYTSLILTVFLSVCRFVSIRFPFMRIPTKKVLVCLAFIELVVLALQFEFVIGFTEVAAKSKGRHALKSLYCQGVLSPYPKTDHLSILQYCRTSIQVAIGLAGIIFSLWTAHTLMRQETVQTNQSSSSLKRGCQALLFMNLGNAVTVIAMILYGIWGVKQPYINFLGSCGMIVMMSAFNPVLRIYFSSEIQGMVKKKTFRFLSGLKNGNLASDAEGKGASLRSYNGNMDTTTSQYC